jgi:hypothetical protein
MSSNVNFLCHHKNHYQGFFCLGFTVDISNSDAVVYACHQDHKVLICSLCQSSFQAVELEYEQQNLNEIFAKLCAVVVQA